MPKDWSPDGKWIAVQIERGAQGSLSSGESEIALISVESGVKRVLKTYEYTRRHRPKIKFSPEGRYLAFDLPVSAGATDTDLRVLSIETGQELTIAAHPGPDEMFDWTPNGDLLFASDRTGRHNLFRVKLANGRQEGEPEIVTRDFEGNSVLGLSRDGTLYYAESDRRNHSYQAELDSETGEVVGDPVSIGGNLIDGIRSPIWSPDGSSIAYLKMRPSPGMSTVVIRDEKGSTRELFPSIDFGRRVLLRWHGDGSSLFALGRGREKTGLFRIDAISGETKLVAEGEYLGLGGDWSSNGHDLFYRGTPDQRGVIQRNTLTGEEKTLHVTDRSLRVLRLSPDDKLLFFGEENEGLDAGFVTGLLSIETGETHPLVEIEKGKYLGFNSSYVTWSPDGKRVYCVIRHRSDLKDWTTEVLLVDLEEEKLRNTGLSHSDVISHLAIRPDGRELAWTVSTTVRTPWAMENFLDD